MTRALALTCVLLSAFASFAQAVHVHANNTKLPSHECSVCSVAHAGIIGISAFQADPVVGHTVLVVLPEIVFTTPGFSFLVRIRPPPAA